MTDRATHLRRIERERREALVLLERGAEGFEFRPLTGKKKKNSAAKRQAGKVPLKRGASLPPRPTHCVLKSGPCSFQVRRDWRLKCVWQFFG